MNAKSPVLLGLTLAMACGTLAAVRCSAQTNMSGPPKVLEIMREFVKPGKQGAIHDRSESAFVRAMRDAGEPVHYMAVCSLSGRSRCLYLVGYPSYDALQKDSDAMAANKNLSARISAAEASDGELLEEYGQSLWTYIPDQSFHPRGPTPQGRFLEVTEFHVRLGHGQEWNELSKMYIAACEKSGANAHWAVYHLDYGGPAGIYLILSGDRSLAEIDSNDAEDKKITAAMGEDGMKRFRDLEASAIESVNSQLFAVNPAQSYVSDEWLSADPGFWKTAQ